MRAHDPSEVPHTLRLAYDTILPGSARVQETADTTTVISRNHPNRQLKNYALYDAFDSALGALAGTFRGVVYDLGCGEKPYRDWIVRLPNVASYVGVDWGSTQHRLEADVVADLNATLPIDDGVADTILSLSVMEHLREPELFLLESHRILKSDGTMIVQVPFMWGLHEAPHDYFRYTKFGLHHLFAKTGFTDIRVFEQTGFWVMWTVKLNYHMSRMIRGPRWLRAVIRSVFAVVWVLDQSLAKLLDKWIDHTEETAGYFVTARKP